MFRRANYRAISFYKIKSVVASITESTELEISHSPPRCTSPNSFLHQTVERLQSIDKLDSNGASQLIRMGIRLVPYC